MRITVSLLVTSLAVSSLARAQTAPEGTYGFEANAATNNPLGQGGGAVLGLINFDASGGVSGSYVLQQGANSNRLQQTVNGALTGAYSGNPDGTGALNLQFDAGFSFTFATVLTEGGQGIQLVSTSGGGGVSNLGGGSILMKGPFNSLTGTLPASVFFDGASGDVTLPASPLAKPVDGTLVFSSSGASSSGTLVCDGGSPGTWSATVAAFTMAVTVDPPLPGGTGNAMGNYVLDLGVKACGQDAYSQLLSGALTGDVPSSGPVNLVLEMPGFMVNGVARGGISSSSVSGSYGVRIDSSPVPASLIGTLKLDGAGSATLTFASSGPPGSGLSLPTSSGTQTGTYSISSDGTGSIKLAAADGRDGLSFSFVASDGGAQLLLLQTNASAARSVTSGVARAQ